MHFMGLVESDYEHYLHTTISTVAIGKLTIHKQIQFKLA